MGTTQDKTLKAEEREAQPRYRKISYWNIAWRQILKNRLAVFGLWCILFLALLAVYAPLIALNKPFYVRDSAGLSFPFFYSLFDRNFFENEVDIFFNLLMVGSPFLLLSWFILRKRFPEWRWGIVAGLAIIVMIVYIFLLIRPYQGAYQDYKQKIAEMEKAGKLTSCLFPILRYSYRESSIEEAHPQPPSRRHWFGTDKEGRDVFTRMLYGTRISMSIGVVAVAIYVTIGVILGSLAGYFVGKVDLWIMRLIEVMICFPTFFLILTLSAFIEKRTIFHVMFIIGITSWTGVARLVRAEFLRLRNMDYVQAAIALGLSKPRIIFGHVLPNALAPVLVAATFGVAAAILVESSLSFLGLGDPTAPSWGEILNVGRMEGKLWLIFFPGFAIFFVVSVFNLVGEALRDALDPRLRQ